MKPTILDKNCVECSSEFNATLMKSLWQILKELGPFKCPKVWKWCFVLHAAERFKELIICGTYFFAWNKTLFKIWGFWESVYSSTKVEATYMNFGICFVAFTSQKCESLSLLGIWIFHYSSCAEQINHEWILACTIMIHCFINWSWSQHINLSYFVWNEDMRVWMDVFVRVLHQYIVLSLVTVIWFSRCEEF